MKLEQLNPANVTPDQIRQSEEYKALQKSNDPDRLFAACLYFVRGDVTADEFIHVASDDRKQAVGMALEYALGQVGTQRQVEHTARRELINKTTTMTWQPSGSVSSPKTNNKFVQLILGTGSVDLRSVSCVMNCWEAVITAAILDGQLKNPQRLKEIYLQSDEKFTSALVNAFASGRKHGYNPLTLAGTPIAGDIVFFDDLGHVALATGERSIGVPNPPFYPGTNIISFWPAPALSNFGPGSPATVEVTTIESITNYATTHGMGALKVTFGSPLWSALNG